MENNNQNDSRYPFTYSCDLIRAWAGHNENGTKLSRSDASTIRHNRARGSHNIELMSTIVTELVEMGKGDAWICKHVGMSIDELLRMKQITGLSSLFQNREFSKSWEADSEFEEIEK